MQAAANAQGPAQNPDAELKNFELGGVQDQLRFRPSASYRGLRRDYLQPGACAERAIALSAALDLGAAWSIESSQNLPL